MRTDRPELTTTLTWALPVKVDKLGAHLEAYVATLSTITALRLCHKFGTGTECFINKLPVELVQQIGEYFIEPEREKALQTWSQELRCAEGECSILQHYTQEEQYQLYHLHYGCLDEKCYPDHPRHHDECNHKACEGDKCPAWKFDPKSDETVVEQLYDSLEFYDLGFGSRCDEVEKQWSDKLVDDTGFFGKHQELLKTHFGIHTWTEVFRPAPVDGHHLTATAYLTLPDNIVRRDQWIIDGWVNERFSYGMPVSMGAPPTEQSLSRFPRALRILGLQAWINPRLEGQPILSPPVTGVTTSEMDEKAMVQPQLTFLVRSVNRS